MCLRAYTHTHTHTHTHTELFTSSQWRVRALGNPVKWSLGSLRFSGVNGTILSPSEAISSGSEQGILIYVFIYVFVCRYILICVLMCVLVCVFMCVLIRVSCMSQASLYMSLFLSFRCMCLHGIMICPHVSSCTPSLFLEKNNKQREVIRGSENDEDIAYALLRLSGKLGIFAQPSAFADNQKKKT